MHNLQLESLRLEGEKNIDKRTECQNEWVNTKTKIIGMVLILSCQSVWPLGTFANQR